MPIIDRLRTNFTQATGGVSDGSDGALGSMDSWGIEPFMKSQSSAKVGDVSRAIALPPLSPRSAREALLQDLDSPMGRLLRVAQEKSEKANLRRASRRLTAQRGPTARMELKIKEILYSKFQAGTSLPENLSPAAERVFFNGKISEAILEAVQVTGLKLPEVVLKGIEDDILDGIVGFGPIQKLLNKENVSEIMVNGADHVYIEERGKLRRTNVCFRDPDELYRVIEKIVIPVGRRCDEFYPYTDARLPDGSRVNIVIPPLSLIGPVITIRRFSKDPFKVSDLVTMGTLTQSMADFVEACVQARMNIIVSGGTGSGKTTTLNAISGFLPETERIITIEDSAELQLMQPHVVSLETRQANVEGKGTIAIRDLFRNALRMIPKRIVVGECRGGETLDMISAMSTGNRGSLTTAHANSPKDMLARLETMIMMAGMSLSSRMIRELVASALNIIVQQERLADGRRRITHIAEVTGILNGEIQIEDIYRFVQTGVDDRGNVLGVLKATGYIPKCLDSFFEEELKLPENLFEGVAPISTLRNDWKTRVERRIKSERERIRATIALQMALDDSDSGSPLGPDVPRPARQVFGWLNAVVQETVGSTEGRAWATEYGTLFSLLERKNPNLLIQKLSLQLKEKGADVGALADQRSEEMVQHFKRAIVTILPARLAFERGDRPFDSRDQEFRVVGGMIEDSVAQIASQCRWHLPPRQRKALYSEILADVVGLGPIQKYIDDSAVSEVMVNGPHKIYVEVKGKIQRVNARFEDNAHVMHILRKIITPLGRRCDESNPMVDARTQEGFRVNAIIPPLSLIGPVITIRKFADKPLTMEKLVDLETVTPEAASFIWACIQLKLNIFVSGGTGSGKTTTLNAISGYIPECRIITVEDAAELRLQQNHVAALETRPPNLEGKGGITIRDLVRNALHMRPDRIIVGECRGGEALDMIASMSTGNAGSLSTGHANTPGDLLRRLETMIMMSGVELPLKAIRDQIASAVDLIIQQDRMQDGSRKITHISEVLPSPVDGVKVQHIYRFKHQGLDEATGKVLGQLEFTGIVPSFLLRFHDEGVALPEGVFGPKIHIKDLLIELDQRRREAETETLKDNLKKSRTYEDTVLLDAEFFEREGNPLALLDNEAKTEREGVVLGDKVSMAEIPQIFSWRQWLDRNFVAKREERKLLDQDEKNRRIIEESVLSQDFTSILLARGHFYDEEEEKSFLVEHLKGLILEVLNEKRLFLRQKSQDELAVSLAEDILQLGPIQPLMDDDTVSEIMINGAKKVFVERFGKIVETPVRFRDDEHLMRILSRILTPIGRRCDVNSPLVDARTKQGYRLNAAIPPVSPVGPVVTIRKFSKSPMQIADLIRIGSLSTEMAEFISGSVQLKVNIIVSGGTGSGKTTMLNAISAYVPEGERIVTIEDTAELQLQQQHVVSLETRQPNQEGKGAIPIRELVRNSLRMQPHRIVVGECRGAEALDMLQAMNTGNAGSLTTAHASSPKDMMSRIETMALMARSTLSAKAIREQIAAAIDLVVQVCRFRDGTRKVTHISEVTGIREDVIELADIFVFEKAGLTDEGKIKGRFKATGNLPSFLLKFHHEGIRLPENLFGEGSGLSRIYDRLLRELRAKEVREKNRQTLRSRWGGHSNPEEQEDRIDIGDEASAKFSPLFVP